MTVTKTNASALHETDGLVTDFPFEFAIGASSNLSVQLILSTGDITDVPDTDYDVVITGAEAGYVAMNSAPSAGQKLYVSRQTQITQLIAVTGQTKYDPVVVERVWDKLTQITQELQTLIGRAILTVPGFPPENYLNIIAELRDEAVAAASLAGAWAESPTNPNPGDPTSKSAKTWASQAETAAAQALLYGPLTFPSASAFFASSAPDASMIGKRAGTQDGLAWDVVAAGTGDFDHPVTGVGVSVVAINGAYYFEAWGAGPGVLPEVNRELMQSAIDKVTALGGGTLRMFPGSGPWNWGGGDAQNLLIRASNVHIDCQGAVITSNARFNFRGNVAGVDGALDEGDESHLLNNVSFRNARFGDPDDFDAISRGPIFEWVADAVLENCHRVGRGGTCFNMHFARRPRVKNISAWGAREVGLGGTIGLLAYHTHDGVFEDVRIGGPGEWVYVVQQKGGTNNKWVRTVGHDVDYANSTGHILRDRGDNPYDASPSTGPYPYSGGSWDSPDLRRASIGTEWIDCSAVNCPDTMPGITLSESKGCRVRGLRAVNARGVLVIKDALAPAGYSDGHEFSSVRMDSAVFPVFLQSSAADPLADVKIRGLTIRGVRSQSLSTQRDILLSNTKGIVIEDFDIEGGSSVSENAVRLVNSSGTLLRNGRIAGAYTSTTIAFETDADRPVVESVDLRGAVVSGPIIAAIPGLRSRDAIAGKYHTTDATLQNLTRARLPNDTTAYLEVEIVGKSAGGFMALRLGRWYQTSGSTMTALGANVDTISSLKTGTAGSVPWGGTLNMVSNEVRIQFQGAASEDIDWTVSYSWRL